MITPEKAQACLEAEATKLKEMSYEELEEFAESRSLFDDWQTHEVLIDGHKVYVNTLMGKLGRIHKRISVELTLSSEDQLLPADTPCLYFERYASGRLYPSPREKARDDALLKALPYALVAVFALLALVWHLFLRTK